MLPYKMSLTGKLQLLKNRIFFGPADDVFRGASFSIMADRLEALNWIALGAVIGLKACAHD